MLAVVCPGQGSQTPGMLSDGLELPGTDQRLAAAPEASNLDRVAPGNEAFFRRLEQSIAADAGFSENELTLEVGGLPLHLHCVISPVEAGDSRLLIELRELEQQLKIAREAKILEQQEANRELIRNLAH